LSLEKRMYARLKQHSDVGVDEVEELAFSSFLGFNNPKSPNYVNVFRKLKNAGHVELVKRNKNKSYVQWTADGVAEAETVVAEAAAAGSADASALLPSPRTDQELRSRIAQVLDGKSATILEKILELAAAPVVRESGNGGSDGDGGVDRDALGGLLGYGNLKSPNFVKGVGQLVAYGFVVEEDADEEQNESAGKKRKKKVLKPVVSRCFL